MLTPCKLMGDRDSQPSGPLRDLGLFGVIIADVLGLSGAGFGLGFFLWKKTGFPWWVIVPSTALGFSAAMYRVYRLGKKDERRETE